MYEALDFRVRRGERLALVGPNGAGKSTLLKLLAEAVPADGGEKARLSLARMLARPANLLLLDEPTNHLDLESREVLETALTDYGGTMVFISHDRWFINRLATRVVEVTPGGVVTDYPGDYDYYLWKRDAGAEAEAAAVPAAPLNGETDGRKGAKLREAKKAAERAARKREKEGARLEAAIEDAEKRMAEIDGMLCDEKVYADAALCRDLLAERADLEAKLPGMYAAWETATGG